MQNNHIHEANVEVTCAGSHRLLFPIVAINSIRGSSRNRKPSDNIQKKNSPSERIKLLGKFEGSKNELQTKKTGEIPHNIRMESTRRTGTKLWDQ